MLLLLTKGEHEPWCLVVDDLSKPAFFQPPVPEGTLEGWKLHSNPDDIDILLTAKCHDVKKSLTSPEDGEAWVLALCALQTQEGYGGATKYGLSLIHI